MHPVVPCIFTYIFLIWVSTRSDEIDYASLIYR